MIDIWFTGPRPKMGDNIRSEAGNASASQDSSEFSVEASRVDGHKWGVRVDLSEPSDLSAETRENMKKAIQNAAGGAITHHLTEQVSE